MFVCWTWKIAPKGEYRHFYRGEEGRYFSTTNKQRAKKFATRKEAQDQCDYMNMESNFLEVANLYRSWRVKELR